MEIGATLLLKVIGAISCGLSVDKNKKWVTVFFVGFFFPSPFPSPHPFQFCYCQIGEVRMEKQRGKRDSYTEPNRVNKK